MNDTATGHTEVTPLMERILYEVKRIVVGQDHFLERVLVAILAQGHLLVEGVPGLAKTLTVKTLARTVRGSFKRIQFTPDLVPADLVGTRIYNQKTSEFNTSLGPVFSNLLLADEINRAPAKVQSALLEVMQEYQVTIAGETHWVPVAVSRDGDAEPDRDRRHLSAARSPGRPFHDEGAGRLSERGRGVRHRRARDGRRAGSRRGGDDGRARAVAARVPHRLRRSVADPVRGASRRRHAQPRRYGIKDLARYLTYGASPRATIHLIEGARALAYLRGRAYVLPEDVSDLAPDVLRHRLSLSYEALADAQSADQLIQRIMQHVPRPEKPLETHVRIDPKPVANA